MVLLLHILRTDLSYSGSHEFAFVIVNCSILSSGLSPAWYPTSPQPAVTTFQAVRADVKVNVEVGEGLFHLVALLRAGCGQLNGGDWVT